MHPFDEGFEPPEDCVLWCRNRTHDLHVLDDGALVDLDWWNRHLHDDEQQIRLRGRDLDGRVVTGGRATVLRNDLRLGSDLVDADHDGLGLLYLCAAWRSAHPKRRAAKRFPDVSNRFVAPNVHRHTAVTAAIDQLVRDKRLPDYHHGTSTGWPELPSVGVALTTVFAWAVGVTAGGGRAQLLDQYGVSTLLHLGWLEDPAVSGFTRRRYDRYLELIRHWADVADTSPELVERWLVERWNARIEEARSGAQAEPTLF
ncbi:8-oxoguanine DNA glycosylase OGG fold protein [Rhodococcus sp. NPDC054953]